MAMSKMPETKNFLNGPLRLLIVGLSVFLLAFYAWSSNEARKSTSNRVIDWLPAGTKELDDFLHYFSLFPEGELLMVSWAGCDRNDSRLDDVAKLLCASVGGTNEAYFERVLTTRSLIEDLTAPPIELDRPEARRRLSGWLIGKDRRVACLVAMISPFGGDHRAAAIEHVFATVRQVTGLDDKDIHVAGPSIDSVAIDEISTYSQQTLLPFFLAFCLILLLCCLRHFFPALLVFGVALMNEELGGTLLYWTGAHVDSISMLISSLVYVLTISAGVHLVNYYRETLREGVSTAAAPLRMVRKAAAPCALSAITTVLGMGSLAVSRMIPIQTFGKFASFALLLGTAWLFLVVTAVFQQFPVKSWVRKTPELRPENEDVSALPAKPSHWNDFAQCVEKGKWPITIFAFLLTAFCVVGVGNLRTTVTFHGMLPEKAKVIQDYNFLESSIGGLIPVEVVLQIPDAGSEGPSAILDQLYFLQEMQAALQSIDGIDTAVSALNFVPDLPNRTERTVFASGRRIAMERLLGDRLNLLQDTRMYNRILADEKHDEIEPNSTVSKTSDTFWRMSLRISTQSKVDYDTLLKNIRERLKTLKNSELGIKFLGYSFNVTGGVPLVHRAQQQLLNDLIESFVMAFGLIALAMMLMLRGVVRGLLAMVPNLFPCFLVFGTLGWLGWPIDMGSMMTASVALGIAVDGTLHYLTWFNIGLGRGMIRRDAVFFAFRCCATALTQTTIICSFGMLVFGLSEFVPISRFAVMMCVLLTTALIGDIVVLPAMLLTPLGRIFERRKKMEEA